MLLEDDGLSCPHVAAHCGHEDVPPKVVKLRMVDLQPYVNGGGEKVHSQYTRITYIDKDKD